MNSFGEQHLTTQERHRREILGGWETIVDLNSQGQEVAATLYEPTDTQGKHPGVLFLHGWGGDQTSYKLYANNLLNDDHISLTFDFRGHGYSEGNIDTLTRENFLNDALVAYDYLCSRENVDPNNINLVGSSFGAYIAAILSSKRNARSLVLRVPADYPDDGFDEPRMQTADKPGAITWRSRVRNHDDTLALRSVHDFEGDVLVVESELDTMVPHGTVQSYLNASPNPDKTRHILMEGASHSFGKDWRRRDEFGHIIRNWLTK